MQQPLASELRYIDRSGLAYQVIGEGSGKPPLLMLHGYSLQSTGKLYAPLYRYLVAAFTIYALDTHGHGASAHLVDGWTLHRVADDVAAAVRALGIAGAVHAGHSYGGYLGLLTELRHPGTFSSLSLLAPAAASGGAATPGDVTATIVTQGRDRAVMKDLFAGMYVQPPAPDDFDLVIDAVTLMDGRVHHAYFNYEYPNSDITSQLQALHLPVLSVTGAKDVVVSPAEQRATSVGLRNGKEVCFSNEGHMLPLEAPERTAREVIRFVQEIGT